VTSNETESRSGGSVPHVFRQSLSWRWAKEMPRPLRGGFLTMLYALSSLADAAGFVRFARDRKPVRISDIAVAAGCDEKDARRYLHAAEMAGVVVVEGERKRGRTTLYVISVVIQNPDWGAAVSALDSTRRKSRAAPPWLPGDQEKNGGHTPELSTPKNGGHTPELQPQDPEEVRGTHPRMSSGDTPPNGSGDTPPNNPGITHEVSHDMADVVALPQPSGTAAPEKTNRSDNQTQPGWTRCAVCHERMLARSGRDTHSHCVRDKPA
jgi:hypothetical protein